MSVTVDARVKQKTDTEANWLANPLPLLDGEQAFTLAPDGVTPYNFKIGVDGKTFDELPYFYNGPTAASSFGVKSDGVTPAQTALTQALMTGKTIYLEPNGKYYFSQALTLTDQNISIVGNGAEFICDDATAKYMFTHNVTNNTHYPVVSITPIVIGLISYVNIVFTGVISDLQKGDIMKIWSQDQVMPTVISNVRMGEHVAVNDISVASGNTTITVEKAFLDYAYATTIQIAKVKTFTFKVQNLKVRTTSNTNSIGFAFLNGTYNATIDNPVVNRTDWPFISLIGCYCPEINNPMVNFIGDSIDGNSSVTGSIGYGINDGNSTNLKLNGGTFRSLRHAYTTGNGSTNTLPNDYNQYGEVNGAVISNVTANGCQTPFDTHESGYNITFIGCKAIDSRVAYQSRARNVKFINLSAHNYTSCFFSIINGSNVQPGPQNGIYITNPIASGTCGNSFRVFNTAQGYINYIKLTGGFLIGRSDINLSNININGTTFRLNPTDVVAFLFLKSTGRLTNLRIEGDMSIGSFGGIEQDAPNNIYTENITWDIGPYTTLMDLVRASNTGGLDNVFQSINNVYLNAFPKAATASDSYPYGGESGLTIFQYSYSSRNMGQPSYFESISGSVLCQPKVSDPTNLTIDHKYLADDVLFIRISGLSGDITTQPLNVAARLKQRMLLYNLTNFTVTIPNTNIGHYTGLTIPPWGSLELVWEFGTWLPLSPSYFRLPDRPLTLVAAGITDGFQNRGSIGNSVDLNTLVALGCYYRGSSSGNTTALNYPIASCPTGMLSNHAFTNSVLAQYYHTTTNVQYRRFNNSGTWTSWVSF